MAKPQQPEIGRSRKTPSQDPDSTAAVIQGSRPLGEDGPRGPVPPDNQPGHHPSQEQDRPDLDAFAERLGTATAPAAATSSGAAPAGDDTLRRYGRGSARTVVAAVLAVLAVLLLGRTVRRRRASA